MTTFDSKSALLEEITRQIQAKFPPDNGNLSLFIYQFFKRVPFEFMQKAQMTELLGMFEEAWRLLQIRQPNESLVTINQYQLSHQNIPRLGIYMINLDQPFLIDTVTTFLEKNGYKIELLVHPVLGIQRTREGNLISIAELREAQPLTSALSRSKAKHLDYLELISSVQWNVLEETDVEINSQSESMAFIQVKPTTKKKPIEQMQREIYNLMGSVRKVVSDWPSVQELLGKVRKKLDQLSKSEKGPSSDDCQEIIDFLDWLERGHFVFLGVRYYKAQIGSKASVLCLEPKTDFRHLGLFRDEAYLSNEDLIPCMGRLQMIPTIEMPFQSQWPPYLISKTNARSTVHRASRIDSIEVMDWDEDGNLIGLYQFIGIFTKASFEGSAFDTPIVSRKVQAVFNRFGLAPQWHDGKTLRNIINSIPRDELFYLAGDQIYDVCQNVLNMNDQNSLTVFMHPDIYGRYVSIMVYLSKEKYSVALKEGMTKIFERHLKGKMSSDHVFLGELEYARFIFVVTFPEPSKVTFNQTEIENEILEASLSWEDHFERLLSVHHNEEEASALFARYQPAFPIAYKDAFSPAQALPDINFIEQITVEKPIDLYLYKDKKHKTLKVKIFHAHVPLSLSILLPILRNLDLPVIAETSYVIQRDDLKVWIHDIEVDSKDGENWQLNKSELIKAFHQIWQGIAENDILHQLILKTSLSVSQVTLVRAYVKFLRQIQLPFSLGYLLEVLVQYADITRNLVDFFELRFRLNQSKADETERKRLLRDIQQQLELVDRLDHDRILRHVLNAIESTVRTNYFQTGDSVNSQEGEKKSYLSLKFESKKLDDIPHPCPLYEIFIYSPRFEAIHLRGAKVARGGIRWSDRQEDFRTEVLGLMKAQTVKNAVIVPVGSKGGFVVKNQSNVIDPGKLRQEVVSCYQMMMRGLLDITDNLVKGKIVPPLQVIRYDEDDPYLVVAADKGTAEFSDIANSISREYDFWLDDAFASGGSEGYDHKKIGITARGVWESVKRHFREMKIDCQITPFTVLGVGDMSGDVFGNGMLQSSAIRLLAAFNHQYIFLDPDPDPQKSFQERKRLFTTHHSTWKNYNPSILSKGGGVFERSLKAIPISPECRKVFQITKEEMTPDELIKHLLCLPIDMIYFGGIGTFIKATSESQSDVGDRANNDVRVDAKDVCASIIAEGANLGMTQRARIEYALKGGRLNTDAIDNSGGVDCSDHEVNLKILFKALEKTVSREERNVLLKEMTEDISELVIADNYRQNQILSLMEAAKAINLNLYQSLIRSLETESNLDRNLEALPDDETIEQRRARNQGMTRPELAVLLAYSKIDLYEKILSSSLPEDSLYQSWYQSYFPEIIQKRFKNSLAEHPLRREITATILANEVVNRVGPAFIYDIALTGGVSRVEVAKSFFLASEVLELKKLWDQIDSLDALMISDVQTQVLTELNQALEQITLWFLRHLDVEQTNFSSLQTLISNISLQIHDDQQHIMITRKQGFEHLGIASDIAQTLALIPFFPALLDILYLGKKHQNVISIARTYFELRSKMGLDWLMVQTSQIHAETQWQRSARTILMDDFSQVQVKLTNRILLDYDDNSDNVEAWLQENEEKIHHIHPIIANIKTSGRVDLGMLSYAMRQLERLV